jgi:hypothetical protein
VAEKSEPVEAPSVRARIEGVDPGSADEPISRVLEQQMRKWGSPLGNHRIYARRESIFSGAQAMWRGLRESGLLDSPLSAMVNRRVALLNKCEF